MNHNDKSWISFSQAPAGEKSNPTKCFRSGHIVVSNKPPDGLGLGFQDQSVKTPHFLGHRSDEQAHP